MSLQTKFDSFTRTAATLAHARRGVASDLEAAERSLESYRRQRAELEEARVRAEDPRAIAAAQRFATQATRVDVLKQQRQQLVADGNALANTIERLRAYALAEGLRIDTTGAVL